jgi:hypothetical protein
MGRDNQGCLCFTLMFEIGDLMNFWLKQWNERTYFGDLVIDIIESFSVRNSIRKTTVKAIYTSATPSTNF